MYCPWRVEPLAGRCWRLHRWTMAPPLFYPRDVVKVVHLEADDRDVDSSIDPPRQPRVGEIATIVEEVAEGIYLVERSTDDGRPLWTAEFLASELELVERQ